MPSLISFQDDSNLMAFRGWPSMNEHDGEHGESCVPETKRDDARSPDSNEDVDDSDLYLSEHTVSMRKACYHGLLLFRDLEPRMDELMKSFNGVDQNVMDEVRRQSNDHKTNRERICRDFWTEKDDSSICIPRFHFEAGNNEQHKVQQFQREFHNRNLPCLVTGLNTTSFSYTNEHWSNNGNVNRQWFLETLGEGCEVPLRYNKEAPSLDNDGRADECKTRKVSIKEWVEMLLQTENVGDSSGLEPTYYLKDWHLQQIMQEKRLRPLYSCPVIFERDLLNSFLTKFTQGDYRFCYWGPANSSTLRHSDVLHSFSWSFNAHGTKKWTFYSPFDDTTTFTVIQKTGQAIFVPATWQHQVVNLEETVSINHNWITTANLDLTWDCLMTEMVAIRDELTKWQGNGTVEQDLEPCENMLRGCVGLDVSSFFFMTILRLVEVVKDLMDLQDVNELQTQRGRTLLFDVFRLTDVLSKVTTDTQDLVQLQGRLQATLQIDTLAFEAVSMVETLLSLVNNP